MHELHNYLPLLLERMKLETNLHDEKGYVAYIQNLNQGRNHGLVLKKMHRIIKFKQEA